MTGRMILQAFNDYQIARLTFVKTISDLASRPENINALELAGVLNLLEPLLTDKNPSVQQHAVIALGRLVNFNVRLAEDVIKRNVITGLIKNIDKQNKFLKKAVLFVLRAVSKHSMEMARGVVEAGGLKTIIICLDDFDSGVKEAAAWATGYIARHDKSLSEIVANAGAIPLLVLCLQESDICLKQISASALCDISKHSENLAQLVINSGAISFLARSIQNSDGKLKRQALHALANISRHSTELAEAVVEADIFPQVLVHLGHDDENVGKAAAVLVREIIKHSQELSQLVVNTGGIESLIKFLENTKSSTRLPGVVALGYMAGHSAQSAIMIASSGGISQLSLILNEENDPSIISIAIWALGQIGKHSQEHAEAVAATNIFPKLLQLYRSNDSSEDLKLKIKFTLKSILSRCQDIEFLEPFLQVTHPDILKYTLEQLSKILPEDPKARRLFVSMGGLRKIQEVDLDPGSTLSQYQAIILSCFPEEIVRYFSPGYPDTILAIVDTYKPKLPPNIEEFNRKRSSEKSISSALSLNGEKY
ncbi:sperm-associated antigen 6-like [Fopius arisanus]|uniref:Sperm-associated antigen 6-like n=1 Tax=Fopius arisanus TaxID=64838 RepID=A0A9R1TYR2_9HYME|nr:PREDICTED: sperm-associated antigen 6-like [Fopius arisanus]